MSDQEQEKIIEQLRNKVVKIDYKDTSNSGPRKVEKRIVWEKAKRAGKTISDDTLSTSNPARP